VTTRTLPRLLLAVGFAVGAFLAAAAPIMALAPATFAAEAPVVGFTASVTTGQAPLRVEFAATSSIVPAAWEWDFGDGTTGAGEEPSHVYVTPGTFSVQLVTSFGDGPDVTLTKTQFIVASGPPPPPPVVPPASVVVAAGAHIVGRPVSFDIASTGSLTSWTWTFGDGSGSAIERPTHRYAATGTYTVTFIGSNPDGAVTASTRLIVIPAWTGGIQLYDRGIFSKQATWHSCVAAASQMMLNIVAGARDHSARVQRIYYSYGRNHNGYRTPESDGVDPAGWQAVLKHYVDPGYHLVAGTSFDTAIRAAARAMRLTGRPVGVVVGFGAHVWVISGFTATADPGVTGAFKVTSVNVEGSLWGRTSVNGFDQAPNVRISAARFRYFFTPYRDRFEPRGWRNRYVILAP
jgi:PKD repeat protein